MLRRIILLVSIIIAVLILAAVAALVLIDPDDYREEIAERASAELGREVRLDGPIDLKVFPWLAFEIRSASVGNPPQFDPAPSLAEIGVATASIRLWPLIRGQVEIGAIALEDAHFNLVTDSRGRTNLEGLFAVPPDVAPSHEPGQTDLAGLQTGPVRLRNVLIHLIDLASGERTELAIDALELAPFAPDRDVAVSFRGRVSRDGELVLSELRFDGIIRVRQDLSQLTLSGWEAGFHFPEAELRGQASGDALIDLAAVEMTLELPVLTVQLDSSEFAISLTATEPIHIVLGDPPSMDMPAAELNLDDQPLLLSGNLSLGDPVRGTLRVGGSRLDLRALAAIAGEPDPDPVSGAEPDWTPLHRLDLSASLQLDELVLVDGVYLTGVVADSRLVDGVMTLEPMQAQLFGGRFNGRARVDFNQDPPAVDLAPQLTGVLVEELAGLFSEFAPVAGSSDLTLDLSFSGLQLAHILASLDGGGHFAIRDGVVRGVDLNQLIEQELTVSSLDNVRQAFDGETPFRTLRGSLRAERGVISLPDLELQAAGYGVRGNGRIDFASDQVDYRIELDLGDALADRMPSRLRRATGGRIPLAISGPVSAPVVTVDLAGIAERAVRDELGRRLLDQLDREDESSGPDEGDKADEVSDEPEADGERSSRRLLRGLLEQRQREQSEAPESESEADDPQDDPEPPPGDGGFSPDNAYVP